MVHLLMGNIILTGTIAVKSGVKVMANRAIIRFMRRELMDILVCPVCKGELQLTVEEENGEEIVSGSLYCAKCRVNYSITDTIPDLLPPDQRN